jgi:hypothetical protein
MPDRQYFALNVQSKQDKQETKLTQVFAKVLNLNVRSSASPPSASAHLPPFVARSGLRRSLKESTSAVPFEKLG